MNIKYTSTLLAVADVEVSKKFYREIFDQEVVLDFGINVTFSGGFAIQQDFSWLVGFPKEQSLRDSKNMELYFEVDDFDAFMQKLEAYPDVHYVHGTKKYDWQQRVVRIYDPDAHIIEIGESMAVIARNCLSKGMSVEETSALTQHPVEFVRAAQQGLI